MPKRYDPRNYLDVKPWVIAAIDEEEEQPPKALWTGAPSAEQARLERLKRIHFLRKRATANSQADATADRLTKCEVGERCLSGACPECNRLLQRWFVRRSKRPLARQLDTQKRKLVAISIVPDKPVVQPGQLHSFSID